MKGFGLQQTPKDSRDFKFGLFFKPEVELPTEDFVVAEPLEIKDQLGSDMCVAFSTCSVSEDQEGVALGPEWFFSQIKKMTGDLFGWGANLRDSCKVAVNTGFVEKTRQKYNVYNQDRNFLADWNNWPEDLEDEATVHRKSSYFSIDNFAGNTFDSIRVALWQNRKKRCSVLTGCMWRTGWGQSKDGIIKEGGEKLYGHAFKIFGQKFIDGEPYLIAQLSNGTGIGDNGLCYFPKEVVNRDFTYGAYIFYDIDPSDVKPEVWPLPRRIWETIKNYLKLWL